MTPHREYALFGGTKRPMDRNHNVPGDTPCVCGGIAWYHAAPGDNGGCDDCDECHDFQAVDVA